MLQKSIKCPYFLLFYPKLFFWLCFLSFCIHVKDIFLKLSSQLHLPTHTSFFLSIFTACMIEIAVQLINCAIEANSHKLFDPAQSGPQPSLQRNGQSENRSHSLSRPPPRIRLQQCTMGKSAWLSLWWTSWMRAWGKCARFTYLWASKEHWLHYGCLKVFVRTDHRHRLTHRFNWENTTRRSQLGILKGILVHRHKHPNYPCDQCESNFIKAFEKLMRKWPFSQLDLFDMRVPEEFTASTATTSNYFHFCNLESRFEQK